MRTISEIIIHCSAITPEQQSSASDIDVWHKKKGWSMIGYHYVVRRNGNIEKGRPLHKVGAHCRYHNTHSIGICYEGGIDSNGQPADTRTSEQVTSLLRLITSLKKQYPKALILGHRDFNPQKECPCFDVVKEYLELQP